MRIKNLFLSKWFYYVLIVTILLVFILGFLPFLMRNRIISQELGENLFAEGWGLLFTVLIITMLMELGDVLKWKSVKDKVYRRIGGQLRGILIDFINICECTELQGISPNETMNEFFERIMNIQLEELNMKVELNEYGKKYLQDYLRHFEIDEQSLNNIETKYSRFLDPQIITSIMEIQQNLRSLILIIKVRRRLTEKQFFTQAEWLIHNIVSEIYNLNTETKVKVFKGRFVRL